MPGNTGIHHAWTSAWAWMSLPVTSVNAPALARARNDSPPHGGGRGLPPLPRSPTPTQPRHRATMTTSSERLTDRRSLLLSLTGGLLAGPLVAGSLASPSAAQGQAGKIWRLGLLREGPSERLTPGEISTHFVEALRDLGYVEGRNLVIESRYAGGRPDQLPGFASELARLKVDVTATVGTRETMAAKAATSTIPIVMVAVGDPVGAGLVTSLTHPESNVTGTSLMAPDLGGKRLELLREIVPKLRRVAILGN